MGTLVASGTSSGGSVLLNLRTTGTYYVKASRTRFNNLIANSDGDMQRDHDPPTWEYRKG